MISQVCGGEFGGPTKRKVTVVKNAVFLPEELTFPPAQCADKPTLVIFLAVL